jgi:hypothetical protein
MERRARCDKRRIERWAGNDKNRMERQTRYDKSRMERLAGNNKRRGWRGGLDMIRAG